MMSSSSSDVSSKAGEEKEKPGLLRYNTFEEKSELDDPKTDKETDMDFSEKNIGRGPRDSSRAERDDDRTRSDMVVTSFDIDSVDEELATPLHKTARGGHTDCIRFLLRNGANINAQDVEGATPLHKAVYFKHHQVCV